MDLLQKLTAIEGEIYQYRNQSSQDPLNYPIKLNNKLAALEGVVESADTRPTEQSYGVFKDLSSRLDAQIGRLETFWIPVSCYRVQPILAVADRSPALRPSPDEVAAIIRAPLAAFVPPAPIRIVESTVREWSLRYGAYPVGDHLVWGATARILGQLGALLR
jgi:hypothetical protein